MERRVLGNTRLEVAPLAFGGNVFGWTIDERTSYQLLDAFTETGFNLIDTSDSYCRWHTGKGGESETIIGNWIKKRGKREKVIIATKVGSDMGQGRPDLSKKWMLQEVEASLQRLQTDYIDLYQSHFDDLTTPVGETLEAYAQLIREGKVRAIGASNFSRERLQEALQYSREKSMPFYQTFQPEYNLYHRQQYEKDYEPFCSQNGLGVIPYFPLASGFLTGKYRLPEDKSKSIRGEGIVQKYLNKRGLRILAGLDKVAEEQKASLAAVALAWLLAKPSVTAPIVSATTVEQWNDLAGAAEIRLEPGQTALLDKASAY